MDRHVVWVFDEELDIIPEVVDVTRLEEIVLHRPQHLLQLGFVELVELVLFLEWLAVGVVQLELALVALHGELLDAGVHPGPRFVFFEFCDILLLGVIEGSLRVLFALHVALPDLVLFHCVLERVSAVSYHFDELPHVKEVVLLVLELGFPDVLFDLVAHPGSHGVPT